MSFLTAPQPGKYHFPPYDTRNFFAGMGGVLALSELEPTAGAYRTPVNWPPPAGTFEQVGDVDRIGLGGLGARRRKRLPKHIRQKLKTFRRQLQAQGLPKKQIRAKVRLARQKLLQIAPAGPALRPPPTLPGGGAAMAAQGTWLSPSQLPQSETTPLNLSDEVQKFTLHVADAAQGTWLSPSQVPRWERESAAQLTSSPERFSMGAYEADRDVNPADLRKGEFLRRVRQRHQRFNLGAYESDRDVPITALRRGEYLKRLRLRNQQFGLRGMGADGGQGTWLSPSQVPPWERESAAQVASPGERFSLGAYEANRDVSPAALREYSKTPPLRGERFDLEGMGQMSPQAYARLMALRAQAAGLAKRYVAPATGKGGSHEGGAQMYVDPITGVQSSYIEGKIQLQPICDEKGQCVAYVEPEHVQKMIGQKVQGQSALGTGRVHLPGFYGHPQLGPWGVDPTQAYQYWAAQQAAMQAGAFATPMQAAVAPIWGSPGLATAAPQLPSSPGASSSFASVPGQAAERF